MKLTSKLIAFLLACGSSATASTILSGSGAGDLIFNDIFANPLDSSYSVNIGWLDTAAYDQTNYSEVNTNFISFGSIAFPYNGDPGYNGFFNGSVTYDEVPDFQGEALGGEFIFLFITDGATDWALMEYTGAGTGDRINNDTDIPNTSNVFVENSTSGDFTYHTGTLGAGTITLTAIPEPSTALLGALGGLLLLRRRRAQS